MTDNEIIAKYYELRSCRAVGECCGCSGETIRRVLLKNGIKLTGWKYKRQPPKYHCPVIYTNSQLIECYLKYGSQTPAAAELGVSRETVARAVRKAGIKLNGRSNPHLKRGGTPSKISDAEILEEVKTDDLFEIAKRHSMSPERLYRRARSLGVDVNAHWAEDKWKIRARHYGSDSEFDETITLKSVCDKFGGICQICGLPVDWNDCDNGHIKRMYPTVDHIIPLSKGGHHTWGNVQLAHMKCNAGKCANMDYTVKR